MEDFPGSQPQEAATPNPERKRRRKRRGSVRVPAIASVDAEQAPVKPEKDKAEPTALEAALADLKSTQSEQGETDAHETEAEVLDKPARPTDRQAEENKPDTAGTIEADEADKTYEPLPVYEAEPVEFSGGEVIIHLSGNTPVAEREIPLHPESKTKTARAAELASPAPMGRPITPEAVPVAAAQELPRGTQSQSQAEQPEAPADVPARVERVQPRPEDVYGPSTDPEAAVGPIISAGEQPATKQDVEKAVYQAAKAGQNRGVLTGLLVGAGYEHFKHERREKRTEERFEQREKQLEQANRDASIGLQEQAQKNAETQRQYSQLEKRLENKPVPEKLPKAERPQLERGEQLTVPENHRLETSAWHTIEVDAKTGKPVETPAFQYGHEYYRERTQEATPVMQRNAAAGEVALVAAAGLTVQDMPGSSGSTAQPHAAIPDASTRTQPGRSTSKAKSTLKSASVLGADSGPLWPWLAVLFVVIVVLAITIH